MSENVIEGIYKEGVIKPIGNVKIKNNTKVVITIPDKKAIKSLEGIGKQLVNDEELENFLKNTKKSLSKVI